MTLDKTVGGFKTSTKTKEAVVLKSFGITGSELMTLRLKLIKVILIFRLKLNLRAVDFVI